MHYSFKVSFLSTGDCFFYLNSLNIRKLTKNSSLSRSCIEINFGLEFSRTTYSALSTRSYETIADDNIGLDAVYADLLGIKENDEVCISLANAPPISKVYFRAQDDFQYQLIVQDSSLLEYVILQQVKIINVGDTIPVRVPNYVLKFKTEQLCPGSSYGELQKRTKLVILSPSEERGAVNNRKNIGNSDNYSFINLSSIQSNIQLFNQTESRKISNLFSYLISFIFKFTGNSTNSEPPVASPSFNKQESLPKIFGKNDLLMFRIAPSYFAPKGIQKLIKNTVAVASGFITPAAGNTPVLYKICKTENFVKYANTWDMIRPPHQIYIYSSIISPGDDTYIPNDILYASEYCMEHLNVKFGSGVCVERVVDQGTVNLDEDSFFRVLPSEDEYSFTESVKKIYDDVVKTVVDNVRHHQKINSLITGSIGSGKTYLLKAFAGAFKRLHLSCETIDCKSLRNQKSSKLEKTLRNRISECCRTQPAVMIIDNLDSLIVESEDGDAYNEMYSARVGDMIIDLITSYQGINEITFIASAKSLQMIKDMSTDRGPITFENIHEIGELELNDRCYHLTNFIKDVHVECPKWSFIEQIGKKTKGYNIQDLVDLVKIADFKRLSRTNSYKSDITMEDFESVLAEKVPLSLHGVDLKQKTRTKWEDIGGMEETKNLLKEMFEWPLRYEKLFESCPLRLQCGVLLYGPPGTGKTLIASAVASEFGLNFINIKGPEIFSKYYGASEQGIRDLFSRAKRAKPCLLFFDEFDSLARKRGSSNEDVNDRVVNQLLTELDGVEELTGVFVLAATSRPDLIDPAVLRPGRIDRNVHCTLPTQVERLSILKTLSKNMRLSDDVVLEEIAERTDNYSGADLQAILYASQMSLVKEINIAKSKGSYQEFLLKQRHLLAGLADTKPSLSEEDRKHYDSSYEHFLSSRTHRQKAGSIQQKIMFG